MNMEGKEGLFSRSRAIALELGDAINAAANGNEPDEFWENAQQKMTELGIALFELYLYKAKR